MGIISILGLAFEAIKLILSIIAYIRKLKKDDPQFQTSDVIRKVNEGIEEGRKTRTFDKLRNLERDLKAEWHRRKEGVGVGPDTKGLD
jgi:recombination DNA repair RAD52 pathway protein